MNKPKVWKEEYKRTGNEKGHYIKLEPNTLGDILVVICDKNGEKIQQGSTVLCFDFDYKVILLPENVNENFPLKTDFRGMPLVEESEIVKDHNIKMSMMSTIHEQLLKKEADEHSEQSKH